MSQTVIFIVGALVFALTVYGAVIAGGLMLTRQELEENEALRERTESRLHDKRLPLDARY